MLNVLKSSSPVLLSVAANNWGTVNKDLLAECLYEFGKSGLQIRTQTAIPLAPFAAEPSILDMQRSIHSGEPIPGRYVYHRRDMTDRELVYFDGLSELNQIAFTDDLPLSDRGSKDFRDDTKTYSRALSERTTSDAAALKRLNNITSSDSKTVMLSHPDYTAYLNAPDHMRSLPYYLMLLAIHRTGDASIKYKRTMSLMTALQGDDQLESWVAFLDNAFDQFEVDFADPDNPGFMRLSEFKSFLFLRGCNRTQFQRLYDEQLRSNPSGRFPDTKALMAQFLQFNTNNKMSFAADPVSSQLTAFIAPHLPSATSRPQPSSATVATSRPPRKSQVACIHCLRDTSIKRYGHFSRDCTRRPEAPAQALLASDTTSDSRLCALESSLASISSYIVSLNPESTPIGHFSYEHASRPEAPAGATSDARLSALESSLTSISSYLVSLSPESDPINDPAQILLATTDTRDARIESLEVSLAAIATNLTPTSKTS